MRLDTKPGAYCLRCSSRSFTTRRWWESPASLVGDSSGEVQCTAALPVVLAVSAGWLASRRPLWQEGITMWGRLGCHAAQMDGQIGEGEVGISLAERRGQIAVQRPRADLEQQVRAVGRPLHGLLLGEALGQ